MLFRVKNIGGPVYLAIKGIRTQIISRYPEMDKKRVRLSGIRMSTPGFSAWVIKHSGTHMGVAIVQQLMVNDQYEYLVRMTYHGPITGEGITQVYNLYKTLPDTEADLANIQKIITQLKKLKNMNFTKEREENENGQQSENGD